jgi:hypothetical protein
LLIVQQAVYRHAARKKLRSHVARAPCIGSVHVGVQAVARVVGNPDCIFVVVIGDDTEDGTENLFPGNCHVVLHIDEHLGFTK